MKEISVLTLLSLSFSLSPPSFSYPDKKVEVLDHGLLLQLIDSEDEEAELLKELEAPPKWKEIEPPPKRKEIEAPPPKKKEIEAPPPPPVKKNEPSPKNTISTADLALDDGSKTDMTVDTLTRLVAHTLATKTRLKDVPISLDNLSDSIMDVLKDMSTADLLAHINDEELGITLPAKESGEAV
jgi:outer membrane biosynthesis protein TonB